MIEPQFLKNLTTVEDELEVMREVIDGERRKEIPGYTTDAILFELGPFKQNHLITARIEKGVDLNNLANTAGFIDND